MSGIREVPATFRDSRGGEHATREEAIEAQEVIDHTEAFEKAFEKYVFFLAGRERTADGYPFSPNGANDAHPREYDYYFLSERLSFTGVRSIGVLSIPKIYFRNHVRFSLATRNKVLEVELHYVNPESRDNAFTCSISTLYAVRANAEREKARRDVDEFTGRLLDAKEALHRFEKECAYLGHGEKPKL